MIIEFLKDQTLKLGMFFGYLMYLYTPADFGAELAFNEASFFNQPAEAELGEDPYGSLGPSLHLPWGSQPFQQHASLQKLIHIHFRIAVAIQLRKQGPSIT